MNVLDLAGRPTTPIADYESLDARSVLLAAGNGQARIHLVVVGPGGSIGRHEAGFGQLLVPLIGSGWIAGADGIAESISCGTAGFIPRGEFHSKGSLIGMTALMIQVDDLAPLRQ